MPYPVGQVPWKALAGRKRAAADRHERKADDLRRQAAVIEAEAGERDEREATS